MKSTIYSDGTYLRNNPDWHADDSAWKANHIATLLARHGIVPTALATLEDCGYRVIDHFHTSLMALAR